MKILDFFRKDDKKIRLSESFILETSGRAYLKQLALNVVINYIARTISNSEFRVKDGVHVTRDMLYHKLNVRPNTDASASDFWQKIVYKLIYDNEVLVIKTDRDELIVADDFQRKESALYDDYFVDVITKDYTWRRSFTMSEVLYMNYNNERLSSFIDDLYTDYGKLFGQMMDHSLRHNQFRGFMKYGDGGNLTDAAFKNQQRQVEKIGEIFKNSSVAIAPLTDGLEFEDLSTASAQRDESVNNLVKLKRDLIDDVCKMLGVPTNLIHGDVADLQNTMEAYINFCINPLMKKLSDEVNAKFFTFEEWQEGRNIEIVGINRIDPLRNSNAVDKLASSGVYSRNEVREKFGDERVDDPEMDRYLITKNYTYADDDEIEGEPSQVPGEPEGGDTNT